MLYLFACAERGLSDADWALLHTLSPVPPAPASLTNRFADDPVAQELGRALFFDEALSLDGRTSCASCHLPDRHFTDGEPVATALGTGKRNTPTLETVAYQTWFFWDGRADSPWAQAAGPLLNPLEMGTTTEAVHAHVPAAYPTFTTLFGPTQTPDQTLVNVGKALDAFQRTLSPGTSAFDRFVADPLTHPLPDDAARGLDVFLDAECVNCHNGPLFTDHGFHNLGVPQVARGGFDIGRAIGAVHVLADANNCLGPQSDADPTLGPAQRCPELSYLDSSFADWPLAFKTPTLRNVAGTAPYMHDGSLPTLESVVNFYDLLPGQPPVGHRELVLEPLGLSERERADLVAFLSLL